MEQTSAGEDAESVANALVPLVLLLALGIDSYLAAVTASQGDAADPQENSASRPNHDRPAGR